MNEKTVSTTIEILGRPYPVRCPEAELLSLQKTAAYVNQKMLAIQESGKAINIERIAMMALLNVANDYLQLEQQKGSIMNKINNKISQLQEKLDSAINLSKQSELIYIAE